MKKLLIVALVIYLLAGQFQGDGFINIGGFFLEDCEQCQGNGVCSICDGSGTRSYGRRGNCSTCGGNRLCVWCDGKGKVTKEQQEANRKELEDLRNSLGRIVPIPEHKNKVNAIGLENDICSNCQGNGYLARKCISCDGTGIDAAYSGSEGSILHFFAEKDCAFCDGTGYTRCEACWGSGIK